MTIPSIPCPSCGFTLKPIWFLEKELTITASQPDTHTRLAVVCSVIRAGIKKQ